MTFPLHEVEAHQLLKNEERRNNARRILAIRQPPVLLSVVGFVTPISLCFMMGDFVAPIAVKALIGLGVAGTIMWMIDSWFLRRRLDAAIELLLQREDSSDTPQA